MGQTPGGTGNLGMGLLKGGLTGLGQGLQNYGNTNPQGFDFSKLQQGFQQARRPAVGQGTTPNAAQPNGGGWGDWTKWGV